MGEGHTYSNGRATWRVPDLWDAAKGLAPVLEPLEDVVDMEELLDSHTWSLGSLSVRDIVREADRIANADLSYPIILTPDGCIGDGCHRLIRAWREGQTHILVVRLKAMPLPCVYRNEVKDRINAEKAKWGAIEAAWTGFWLRGGSSPNELRNRDCGASAWLLERLMAAFEITERLVDE
jgi:hypothetical protein